MKPEHLDLGAQLTVTVFFEGDLYTKLELPTAYIMENNQSTESGVTYT